MIPALAHDPDLAAWRCTPPLEPAAHRALCRSMALDAFKWDGQVGDVTTLAPFAIVLPRAVWFELAQLAEALAAELVAAETELAARPELWRELGLPRRVRVALQGAEPWTPAAARVIRFDFHPTPDGWRISEANSDVPGGYTEASVFSRWMADRVSGATLAGDPTAALCDALVEQARGSGRIALLAAPGYAEDLQVVAHLRAALNARGLKACVVRPEQLRWREGVAHVGTAGADEPLDAIFRFYQGEWMTRVADRDWRFLFRGGRTAVCNPAMAVLSESKRLPALMPELSTAMPTWRELLPVTQPVSAMWSRAHTEWVLKRAYCNTGDAVLASRWSRRSDYAWALAHGLVTPAEWIAQRRFETLRLTTPGGPLHPCLGVYTVNGRTSGLYGRLSEHPVTDFRAIDTAILVEDKL